MKKCLLMSAMASLFFSSVVFAKNSSGPKTLVICSSNSPTEGFALVSVRHSKKIGSGSFINKSGELKFSGAYNVESSRLNVRVALVDEDGEELKFLTSAEALIQSGHHFRMIFGKPSADKNGDIEHVELVCNIVTPG